MRGVGAFLIGLRPWLVALVAWVAAIVVVSERLGVESLPAPLELGLDFTVLIGGVGFTRVLWPMRVVGDPPRLVASARIYDVHTYTGHVAGASKLSHTRFHVQSSGGDVSTSQSTTVQDNLTLVGADGTQHNVQVAGVNLPVGPGQLMSAAWAIRPGARRGPYIFFRNHTTGQDSYAITRSWWLATGRWALVYLGALWIGGLAFFFGHAFLAGAISFFVLPFAYIALAFVQALAFRRGARRLIARLDGIAAGFTAQRPGQGVAVAAPAPVPVPPPPPAAGPASWRPDPTGRHEHRYWDGLGWTVHVADNGVPSTDPP